MEATSSTTVGRKWTDRFAELKSCPWYWGDISWKDAERLLKICGDGWFLMRDSRSVSHLFTVTYNHRGHVYHSRFGTSGSVGSFCGVSPHQTDSIVRLIEQTMELSLSDRTHVLIHRRGGEAEASQLKLREPLSRLALLPKLQYLCRLRIRASIHPFRISQLPCSPKLKEYLSDGKFIIPDIEEAVKVLEARKALL